MEESRPFNDLFVQGMTNTKAREMLDSGYQIPASEETSDDKFHGLRTPNEAFFHQNPKLFGFGRQFGQINFGAFLVFLTDLSASILVL